MTMPLPTRPGHVHCYLLPDEDGWTLVDTGVGLPDAHERWATELAGLPGAVRRIFVTHFHPDHVGAAAIVSELTGAEVMQGRLDLAQCRLVWGNDAWSDVLVAWFHRHGAPPEVTHELVEQGSFWRPFIRFADDATPVEQGDSVAGWTLVAAPGHADGQLTLLRDGVMITADHVLDRITPTVGLWPESRPDPLGDYLDALARTIELAPTLGLPGHGEILADPVGRAAAIVAHHRERLDATAAALSEQPSTGYEVSIPLFGEALQAAGRRFAIAETLSHLERLVHEGRAHRREVVGVVSYTSA